jgi:hypothetical protein
MGERRDLYRVLVGIPERKRLLEGPRHRWGGYIKMDVQEIGWWDVDLIDLAQDSNEPFGFHKMQGISSLTEDLLACQKGLCSVELISLLLM